MLTYIQRAGKQTQSSSTNYEIRPKYEFPLHSLYFWFFIRNANKKSRGPRWLRSCATNRKVAGSIPAGVSGFFIDIKSFRSHYGPGVDSASNKNEYQEHFLGVKAAGA